MNCEFRPFARHARQRWITAAKDKAFNRVRRCIIVETQAESLITVLSAGTVSTDVHLRKLPNYCLDMGWLPWPAFTCYSPCTHR